MKKIKYQTKFLLYHTGIMVLLIVAIVSWVYRIVVNEMRSRENSDFSIITEKTATQLDTLYYEMDRTALQIAANPEVVECFQTLPRQEEGNYFTDHPIEKNKMKNFWNLIILKVTDMRGFVCTTCTMTLCVQQIARLRMPGLHILFKVKIMRKLRNTFRKRIRIYITDSRRQIF